MKKIGIILLARYSSKRLPGKSLMEINGKKLIENINDNIKDNFPNLSLIVATSTDKTDDKIETFCKNSFIPCFRGDLNNVSERFLNCAIKHNLDYAIRLNGDNLFLEPFLLNEMINKIYSGNFDFISNVPGRTYPYGLSFEILKIEFYKEIFGKIISQSDKEHVTSWLYDNENFGTRFYFKNQQFKNLNKFKISIDDHQDVNLAKKIISYNNGSTSISLSKLSEFKKIHSKNPDLNFKTNIWSGKHGPMLIAEIGGNHEGDAEYANKLLDLAIESGVDCIKFQLYKADSIVNKSISSDRYSHFKKFELSKNKHIEFANKIKSNGMIYNSSVWDLKMLDWIDKYLDFYKIGSGDLTAWPLLKEFARRGKPILLSTGLSNIYEIKSTIEFIISENSIYKVPNMICILQCTSMYPINYSDANLGVMKTFKNRFNRPVGYSDHTLGSKALIYASALGSSVLEFHFTDDKKNKKFRDHQVSLTKNDVMTLINDITDVNVFLGDGKKRLLPIESINNHHISFRRGAYINKVIKKGSIIEFEDLTFLRPLEGTDSRDFTSIVGSKAKRDLIPLQKLIRKVDYEKK